MTISSSIPPRFIFSSAALSSLGRSFRLVTQPASQNYPSFHGNRGFKKFSQRATMVSASVGQAMLHPEDVVATARITLTPQESKLRNLLLDVARYIDESKEIKERLELRFAGGWVRDKLLAIPSNDIDTAINSMTGYAFSLKMKEYLDIPENRLKHGIENVSNLHKIAANPEKSKHLETVTTKLLGYDLDFVNLRKETYSVDSRNPQMEFGTAKEDALRRDATINALFYNIHTDEVEDFAGGLADLDANLIRTPLEPHQTFVDDPLRVLRLIRFASRLNFKIDTDSELSMGDPEILDALRLKISRERVGVEIEKMLNDNNTSTAFGLIDRLGLYTTIFTNPTSERLPQVDTTNWRNAYNCLDIIKTNESPASIYKLLIHSDESEAVAWILAALSPWAPLGSPPKPPGGKLPLPYATFAAREGIKSNNKICDVVTGASRHYREIINLKEAVLSKEPYVYERDTLGMTIRRWDANGGQWKLHVVLAILVESMGADVTNGYDTFLQKWQKFLDHIIDMDLWEAATCKRIIDGKQLSKELKAKPGVWMAAALDLVMAWQFRNPTETDPHGAIEEVSACLPGDLSPNTHHEHTTPQQQKMTLLFGAAQRIVAEQVNRGVTTDDVDTLVIPLDVLPRKYSIQQLNDGLIQLPVSSQVEKAVKASILERCLQSRERLSLGDDDPVATQKLMTWLIETIRPEGACFLDASFENVNSAETEVARAEWRFTSIFALKSIKLLKSYDLILETNTMSEVLLGLLAFTQLGDTWNSKTAYEISMDTLNYQPQEALTETFIVDYVLKRFLRPLFATSTPKTITSQGRKAPNENLGNRITEVASADGISKPWKSKYIYSVTVFKWVVTRADEGLISRNWHLFIPPLMTLLDDPTTSVRASGLTILSEFLKKTPPRMLIQTGLSDLLEEALVPTLSFLPTLTPVAESQLLLRKAYVALLELGDIRYASDDSKPERNRFYDRLMREGVLYGIHHCGDTTIILELLLAEMSEIVNRLHIHSIKHAKDILPLLAAVLVDPFAPSNPALLLQGIKTIQTTILNFWPILSEEHHRVQIVKALSVCWINLTEEIANSGSEDIKHGLDQLKQELQISAALLCKSTGGATGQVTALADVVNAYPDLSSLFKLE
ncbi:hypothetical protein V492_00549 [Pseudogymnoascus sp. VKM F-4246]|nr:hypothetical protein V492_00549 [Pseudogymnoascus sp. VKM F-4246]